MIKKLSGVIYSSRDQMLCVDFWDAATVGNAAKAQTVLTIFAILILVALGVADLVLAFAPSAFPDKSQQGFWVDVQDRHDMNRPQTLKGLQY